MVRSAHERSINALAFLQGALPENIAQLVNPPLHVHQAASFIDVSVPILRRWEIYGLIRTPRNPKNNYRIYARDEVGWLLVVQSLRQAGYTVSSCKRMLNLHQKGDCLSKSHDRLCDVIVECVALFIQHEEHTNKILEQLHRMATFV
jgi:DNA-binding transcriptional MerR regulator